MRYVPTTREACSIMAALRYWQQHTDDSDRAANTEYFDVEIPLTDFEIDELCEKLNFGE